MRSELLMIVFIGILLPMVGCRPEPPPDHPPPPPVDVLVDIILHQVTHDRGDETVVGVTFRNISQTDKRIQPFPPAIRIEAEWGQDVRLFPAGARELLLGPGEEYTLSMSWDQTDDMGKPVPPGYYYRFWTRVGHVTAQSPSFLIMPPRTITEIRLDIKKTTTVHGFAVTVEKLDIGEAGVTFYITVPGEDRSLWSSFFEAALTVDDGPPIRLRFHDERYDEAQRCMEALLSAPNPITADAERLRLHISGVAGRVGPWIYHIVLRE